MRYPSPVPAYILDPERAPTTRRLDCRLYGHCLDIADREKWPGFGCSSCRCYSAISSAQKAADDERLIDVVSEAFARVQPGRHYSKRRG